MTTAPPNRAVSRRPWRRSRRHRIIAGVCGGLARSWGVRPVSVRIAFVLIGALPVVPGILVYAVLWLLVPLEEMGDPAA